MSKKISVTCAELQRAFKECESKDDALKIWLVYSTNVVLIGAKSNIVVNLDYFHLVEDINKFNDYSCRAIIFEQSRYPLFRSFRRGRADRGYICERR